MVAITLENRLEYQAKIEDELRPLAGEYFLFKFGANFYEPRFNTALTLLQLKDEKFVNLYHPGDYVHYGFSDDTQDKACLKYMLENGIKKVYTLNAPPKNISIFGRIFEYLSENDTDLSPDEARERKEETELNEIDISAYKYHNLFEENLSGLGLKEIKEAGIEVVSLFRYGTN